MGTGTTPYFEGFGMRGFRTLDWRWQAIGLICLAAGLTSLAIREVFGTDEPTAYAAIWAGSSIVILSRFSQFRKLVNRIDWRIGAIFLAIAISLVATLAVYAAGFGRDPATFFGAVFAGWTGSVAFFVVVGAMVAIVSLAHPEGESFDARARILFRREDGPHIDYIVAKLKNMFEHYAQETCNKIIIMEWDEGERKYRVAIESRTIVGSYIDDITSAYKSEIEFMEITPPPPGGASNRLVYLRIDGKAEDLGREALSDSIVRPFTTTIERDGTSEICHRLEVWIASPAEPISHTPTRYTQRLNLEIENHLANGPVTVQVSEDGGKSWVDYAIGAGEVKQVVIRSNLHPDSTAYEVKLQPQDATLSLDPPRTGLI